MLTDAHGCAHGGGHGRVRERDHESDHGYARERRREHGCGRDCDPSLAASFTCISPTSHLKTSARTSIRRTIEHPNRKVETAHEHKTATT